MPLITPQVREQIRAASDIVEIIQGYLPLKRSGSNFVALCPFHREKTPSFHVSPSRQAFHCFGCHKGGDVFRFLQDYENIGFTEAARRLADRAGIRLEFDESAGQREEREIKEQLRDLHEQIARRWQQALRNDVAGQIARDYLARRRVPAEAIDAYRLGYAPDAWDDTVNWARSKGWNLALVERAGLIVPRDPNQPARGHYDRFRGRLMFPIADEQGRIVAFSGRVLGGDEKTAKYVNSPETPIFTKSRVLYGLDKAKRAILDAGSALVCEGQLDTIACHLAGVRHAVAPQGTALTAEHLRILRRYAPEVVLCFDSDKAGQKAIARVVDEFLASGLSFRVVGIPAPHDPDSFVRDHGSEAFRSLVDGARDFFEFYLDHLCRQNDLRTDRGQLAVIENMASALWKTGHEALLDRYAQRTSMALAAARGTAPSPDAVRTEFRRRAPGTARSLREPPPSDPGDPPEIEDPGSLRERVPEPEFQLLKMALTIDELAGWLSLHLDPDWIQDARVRRMLSALVASHTSGGWRGAHEFLESLDDDACRQIGIEALIRPLSENQDGTRSARKDIAFDPERHPHDLTRGLRDAWAKREIAALLQRLADPAITDEVRLAAQTRIDEIRRIRREPLNARTAAR